MAGPAPLRDDPCKIFVVREPEEAFTIDSIEVRRRNREDGGGYGSQLAGFRHELQASRVLHVPRDMQGIVDPLRGRQLQFERCSRKLTFFACSCQTGAQLTAPRGIVVHSANGL